jgi:lipoprotein-anchoring transpeptidase ErfK/SrfK
MSGTRRAALGALALLSVLMVAGCDPFPPGAPRLESIADDGQPQVTATPSPTTPTTEPSEQTPTDQPSSPTEEPSSPTEEPSSPPSEEPPPAPPCPPGDYQLEVEQALAAVGNYGRVTVDGVQSAEDCETIIAFQTRMGIDPAAGTPGPTTKDVADRIAATNTSECPWSDGPQACVDLTHQTFFIVSQGTVILGPTVTRTGMPGWSTPSGTYQIFQKSTREWSYPFSVWMPYWQHFTPGIGLHETTTYIHNMAVGSHGCVNLLHDDAVRAYELLGVGSVVQVYGRRPGT